MTSLPIRRVYVDSRFKTGGTNTEFDFELPLTVNLPKKCKCYVSGFSCPVSWYTVEQNVNDRLYVRETTGNTQTDRVIILDAKNYSGVSLEAELQSKLNNSSTIVYSVSYGLTTGKMTININTSASTFQILTDEELANPSTNWQGGSLADPNSANGILRNSGTSVPHNMVGGGSNSAYVSDLIDLLHVHTIYLWCDRVNPTSLGPRGQGNVLCRLPVTSSYGYVMHYNDTSEHGWSDVSGQVWRSLRFKLTDAYGRVLNLHGGHVSFALILEEA